jgi:cytochrome b
MIRVWDPFVRVLHWGVALGFVVAWLTGEHGERLHEAAGYAAGGLALARVVWGFVGTRYARFAQFVRSPATVLAYLRAIAGGSERRFIGHNPAGGAMIVVLLAAMAATAASGWLLTTNAFWGSVTIQRVHSLLAHGVLLLVLVHLAGVALASFRHRENLVGAMVFGLKRAAGPDDDC